MSARIGIGVLVEMARLVKQKNEYAQFLTLLLDNYVRQHKNLYH